MDSTSNYDLFKYSGLNRKINKIHVQRLITESERMKENGQEPNITKLSPVLVDTKMHVIDGQHRIKAMEALSLPVYYIKANLKANDIVAVNAKRQVWKLNDYISFFAATNPEYEKLMELQEQHKTVATTDISRLDKLTFSHHTDAIKKGKFAFLNYDITVERVEQFDKLIHINPVFKLRPVSMAYIAALKTKDFDADDFIEAVRIAGGIFQGSTESAENYEEIMRVYKNFVKARN